MNTVENNKIIAEFMNWSDTGNKGIQWDWLMEVVEKIESLEFVVTICYLLTEITNEDLGQRETLLTSEVITISCNNGGTKIQTVYNSCLEFIKWYNEQKSA